MEEHIKINNHGFGCTNPGTGKGKPHKKPYRLLGPSEEEVIGMLKHYGKMLGFDYIPESEQKKGDENVKHELHRG